MFCWLFAIPCVVYLDAPSPPPRAPSPRPFVQPEPDPLVVAPIIRPAPEPALPAPPVPPPPPVLVAPPAPRVRALRGDWVRVARAMDAHCAKHGPSCKSDRTLPKPEDVDGGRADTKGRPLGRHLLWLSLAHTCPTMADHKGLLADVGKPAHHGERERLRLQFEVLEDTVVARILAAERTPNVLDLRGEPPISP